MNITAREMYKWVEAKGMQDCFVAIEIIGNNTIEFYDDLSLIAETEEVYCGEYKPVVLRTIKLVANK